MKIYFYVCYTASIACAINMEIQTDGVGFTYKILKCL